MEISFFEDPSIAFTVRNLLGQCAIEAGSGEKDRSTTSKEDDIKKKTEYPLTDDHSLFWHIIFLVVSRYRSIDMFGCHCYSSLRWWSDTFVIPRTALVSLDFAGTDRTISFEVLVWNFLCSLIDMFSLQSVGQMFCMRFSSASFMSYA